MYKDLNIEALKIIKLYEQDGYYTFMNVYQNNDYDPEDLLKDLLITSNKFKEFYIETYTWKYNDGLSFYLYTKEKFNDKSQKILDIYKTEISYEEQMICLMDYL